MKKDLEQVIDDAYTFLEKGDYQSSLEHYEFFFDHSEESSSDWIGAKYRSLSEWAQLAEKYDPAYQALVQRKNDKYAVLQKNKNVNVFRDYINICQALHVDTEAIDLFIRFQGIDDGFTEQAYRYIEPILIDNNKWATCEKFIPDSLQKYNEKLGVFDELMKVSKEAYAGEFNKMYRSKFIKDINNLIEILKAGKRFQEIEKIIQKVRDDMQQRNYDPINFDKGLK